MTDLTKAAPRVAPTKPNPLAFFFLPIVETVSLFVWWLYALTHMVNFPGTTTYSDGDISNGNVVMFNILLIIIVAVSWLVAGWYYAWKKDNS